MKNSIYFVLALNCALTAAPASLPLAFEPNRGQAPDAVRFVSRSRDYQLLLYDNGPAVTVEAGGTHRSATVRMRFAGANASPRMEPLDRLPGQSNYLLGANPQNWRLDIPQFGRVRYQNVYPRIDVVCYGNARRLEYDFVVAPGADPNAIQLAFEGIRSSRIATSGDLLLRSSAGDLVQRAPVAYQEQNGRRVTVSAHYRLRNDGRVGFDVGPYDRSRPLTIDPVMSYATFLGGGGGDDPSAIAVDSAGHAYITGSTKSFDFPTTPGALQQHIAARPLYRSTTSGAWTTTTSGLNTTALQALVAEPAASGVVYAVSDDGVFKSLDAGANWTALSNGLPDKGFTVLAMDPQNLGTLYAGTYSGVFTTANGGRDWQPAGNLKSWITSFVVDPSNPATLYAGTLTEGLLKSTDRGANWQLVNTGLPNQPIDSLAVDPNTSGVVYAGMAAGLFKSGDGGASWTASADSQLSFVRAEAIDSSSAVYAGLASGNGVCKSIDSGASWNCIRLPGNAAVNTLSVDPKLSTVLYASTNRGVFKSSDSAATWTALASGLGSVNIQAFAIDGATPATMYAGTSGGADVFITKLNNTGTAIAYSTYLGGSADDSGNAIAVDAAGGIYVAGTTSSADFPATRGAFQTNLVGAANGFVAKLDSAGKLVYSTYLGGANADAIQALAVDSNGIAYVTGSTTSPDFPTTPGALQTAGAATQQAFVAKFSADGSALISSTLLGAASESAAIALGSDGTIYVTGSTSSSDFPVTPGAFQATLKGARNGFVSQLDSGLSSLLYSTYLGGSASDRSNGMAVDGQGNAYVVGESSSRDFPVMRASFQPLRSSSGSEAFVAKLNSGGSSLVYATYLGGGAAQMRASAVAVDSSGRAYITGSQPGPSFLMTNDALLHQGSGFLSVLDPSGSSVQYATLVGCGCEAIALDGARGAYLTGYADYSMPATAGAAQTEPSEYDKGIVIKLDFAAAFPAQSQAQSTGAATLRHVTSIGRIKSRYRYGSGN